MTQEKSVRRLGRRYQVVAVVFGYHLTRQGMCPIYALAAEVIIYHQMPANQAYICTDAVRR